MLAILYNNTNPMFIFDEEYKLNLPIRNNSKYINIENIPDYEYTYKIAYLMLLRTKSFQKLFDTKVEDRREDWVEKAKALGLDTHKIKDKFKISKNSVLYEDSTSFTIADIGNYNEGLLQLITHYYKKNKIYEINYDKNILDNSCECDIEFEDVFVNPEQYLMHCNDLMAWQESTIVKTINKNLRLRELEDDFLKTLTLKDIKTFEGDFEKYWNSKPLVKDMGEDGISRLVTYYYNKKKIYEKVVDKTTKNEIFKKTRITDYYTILFNHHEFFIPCKVIKNGRKNEEYKRIGFEIPLDKIDEPYFIDDAFFKKEEGLTETIDLSQIDYINNEVSSSLTIDDIKNGMKKLIEFYSKTNRIYPIGLIEKQRIKYKHCNIKQYSETQPFTPIDILVQNERFFIPCKRDLNFANLKVELQKLSKNLAIKKLEDSFLKTINLLDIRAKELTIFPSFSVPMLKFDETTNINLPINLNLTENEIVAYVKKIKNDYDAKNTNLKHPLEVISEKLSKAEKPKSIDEIETKDKKKNIADIFYIYDLQIALTDKKESFFKEYNEKVLEIKKSCVDKDEIDREIEELNEEMKSEEYDDKTIEKKIISLTGFSKNKITLANTYINHYIIKEKYKELITGVSSIK